MIRPASRTAPRPFTALFPSPPPALPVTATAPWPFLSCSTAAVPGGANPWPRPSAPPQPSCRTSAAKPPSPSSLSTMPPRSSSRRVRCRTSQPSSTASTGSGPAAAPIGRAAGCWVAMNCAARRPAAIRELPLRRLLSKRKGPSFHSSRSKPSPSTRPTRRRTEPIPSSQNAAPPDPGLTLS